VFPVTLDMDNPAFWAGCERLRRVTEAMGTAKKAGGVGGKLKRVRLAAAAALTFARLYTLPAKRKALPADPRLAPAW
jgi:magnesium-protoporphyrin IX monomethyl ester (oxidative) cyclase